MLQNERTLRMKGEFKQLRDDGLNIAEIAEKFGLSPSTVYRHLDEIADSLGVSRESLLLEPDKASLGAIGRTYGKLEPVDISGFQRHFESALEEMDKMNLAVKEQLDEKDVELKLFEEDWEDVSAHCC